MELDLSSDQDLLRGTTARLIESMCPLSTVRRLTESDTGLPPGYLGAAADVGWFAMLVPEQYGGGSVSGRGVCDLAIVAEERGRALQPSPFVSMNVVAAALAAAGTPEQRATILPALCRGEVIATWAPGDGGGAVPAASVTATARGDTFALSGRVGQVEAAALADWLLVSARGARGGLVQFIVRAATPGVTVTPLRGLDITQRLAAVSFDDALVPAEAVVGRPGACDGDIERQLHLACALSTVETVGAIDALFELTRQYAVDRTAFGRPIGSFQAVKHQLADMSLALEASKAVGAAAVNAVQADGEDAGEIVSMAKSWVGDAGIDVAQGCAQVFAGIGYTWEHDLHLFLRRITMNSLLFGHPDWHRERICRLHGV